MFRVCVPGVSNRWKSIIGKPVINLYQSIKLVNWYGLVSVNQWSIANHTKTVHRLLSVGHPRYSIDGNRWSENQPINRYQSINRRIFAIDWLLIININRLTDINWYWLISIVIDWIPRVVMFCSYRKKKTGRTWQCFSRLLSPHFPPRFDHVL